jgi:AcrR family transcriptional regulator
MVKKNTRLPPRERIMATATDLFANQGYRATGINEVIEQSGVAKATFYNHFSTKDDLCLAYLQQRNLAELTAIKEFVARKRSPRSRFLGVIESLEPWLEATKLRGCGFLNMVAEIPDMRSPLRQEGKQHYTSLHAFIRELTTRLIDSDKQRYGKLNAGVVADDYMVIIGGAIALVEIHHDIWPVRHGIDMVSRLIG